MIATLSQYKYDKHFETLRLVISEKQPGNFLCALIFSSSLALQNWFAYHKYYVSFENETIVALDRMLIFVIKLEKFVSLTIRVTKMMITNGNLNFFQVSMLKIQTKY